MVGRIDIEKMKGKIKRAAGWLTGDRWVEAEGAVEAERGHPPDPDELAEVEDEVRKDHGDISRDAGGPKDDPPGSLADR